MIEEKCPWCGEPLRKFSGKRFVNGKWLINEVEKSCRKCNWNSEETKHWNKEFEVEENAEEDDVNFLEDK